MAIAGQSRTPFRSPLRFLDLNFVLDEISREFHRDHSTVELKIAYGSSGNFYTQLRNHAPFDIFLSADLEFPRKACPGGRIGPPGIPYSLYGVGRIVVWVPSESALDPATALQSPALKHLAIANPQHAPYGRAAEQAMRRMGVYDSVEGKLVLGENIAQTLQFIQSGAADAGIVALALAIAPSVRDHGRYWEIPLDSYAKMEQGWGDCERFARSSRVSHMDACSPRPHADSEAVRILPAGRVIWTGKPSYSACGSRAQRL